MRTFSRKFFAIGLLLALLVCSTGRAVPVSALADPDIAPALAPVFDTQIYQLQDYINHGGLTDPQYDIFMMLAGMYALAQSGTQAYQLNDPFENEDGVWNWFKSMGIKMYNSVVALIPDTAQMPVTGQVFSTIPFKNAASLYVATLMGMVQKAKTYDTVQEFKQDVATGSVYLPWNFDIQKGMNSIFGIYGGIYSWQFDSSPFESGFIWKQVSLNPSVQISYDNLVSQLQDRLVLANRDGSDYYNMTISVLEPYDLFFDTSSNTAYLVNPNGSAASTYWSRSAVYADVYFNPPIPNRINNIQIKISSVSFNDLPGDIYIQKVRYAFAHFDMFMIGSYANQNSIHLNANDFINHVYIGSNWLDKQEIFNLTDLNFNEPEVNNDIDTYVSVPEDKNYLIDIHDLVTDLVDTTDLWNVIINHIVDEDGVAVHDDKLIKITTSIYNLLREQSDTPALPVNLNDVEIYTDNTYMNLVKDHATSASNTLAQLVAFWHNCDAELIYVLFGSGLTILVGAFIGKWGHS